MKDENLITSGIVLMISLIMIATYPNAIENLIHYIMFVMLLLYLNLTVNSID